MLLLMRAILFLLLVAGALPVQLAAIAAVPGRRSGVAVLGAIPGAVAGAASAPVGLGRAILARLLATLVAGRPSLLGRVPDTSIGATLCTEGA